MISASGYLFLESECSNTKPVSGCPDTKKICVYGYRYAISDNTSESIFLISGEAWLYKAWNKSC